MDGASLVALPPYPYTTPPNATAELARSLGFRCPAVLEAELRNSLNLTTYRYMYAGNFSNISPYYWMGAYHSSELPMIFGTYGDFRGKGTTFQRDTSEAMQDFYLKFANDPENGMAQGGWPKYSEGTVEIFGGLDSGGNEVTYYFVPKDEINSICAGYE
jgi:carboxylesterase type B